MSEQIPRAGKWAVEAGTLWAEHNFGGEEFTPAELTAANAGYTHGYAEGRAEDEKTIAKLRSALEDIASCAGQTLLGPDSKHHMGDSAPCYHEQGANAAFEQAASLARMALVKEPAS